jgi:cell wall-associated NlpC family hydrolase
MGHLPAGSPEVNRVGKIALAVAPVLVVLGSCGTITAVAILGAAGASMSSTTGGTTACTSDVQAVAGLTAEQTTNAGTVIATTRTVVPATAAPQAAVIAVATAMQESTLRNLSYGDRDSIGLFQQRDEWGTRQQRMDPASATTMFLSGGHAGQWGLLDVPGWQAMPVTVAAQAVQGSGSPGAYAKWETLARALVDGATTTCTGGGAGSQEVLTRAQTWLTAWQGGPVPYSMAGMLGEYRRDCSGYASMALGLPGPGLNTAGLAAQSTPIAKSDLQPGDLLINPGAGGAGHVVIFDRWTSPAMTDYLGYEQSGDGGTHHRVIPYPYFGSYPMSAFHPAGGTGQPSR